MRPFSAIARAMVLALAIACALSPRAALSPGRDCGCVVDGVPCGQGGVKCHCCADGHMDMDGGPRIMKCKVPVEASAFSFPPALCSQCVGLSIISGAALHEAEAALNSPEVFISPPQEPPRSSV